MTFLLDVNVLIALLDPAHVSHAKVHRWYARVGTRSWATCPITENGTIRIIGHPRYPNTPGSPAAVATILAEFLRRAGHVFWPDDISILDGSAVRPETLLRSGQVTDAYLLALAVKNRGRLATLDQRIATAAVQRSESSVELL